MVYAAVYLILSGPKWAVAFFQKLSTQTNQLHYLVDLVCFAFLLNIATQQHSNICEKFVLHVQVRASERSKPFHCPSNDTLRFSIAQNLANHLTQGQQQPSSMFTIRVLVSLF